MTSQIKVFRGALLATVAALLLTYGPFSSSGEEFEYERASVHEYMNPPEQYSAEIVSCPEKIEISEDKNEIVHCVFSHVANVSWSNTGGALPVYLGVKEMREDLSNGFQNFGWISGSRIQLLQEWEEEGKFMTEYVFELSFPDDSRSPSAPIELQLVAEGDEYTYWFGPVIRAEVLRDQSDGELPVDFTFSTETSLQVPTSSDEIARIEIDYEERVQAQDEKIQILRLEIDQTNDEEKKDALLREIANAMHIRRNLENELSAIRQKIEGESTDSYHKAAGATIGLTQDSQMTVSAFASLNWKYGVAFLLFFLIIFSLLSLRRPSTEVTHCYRRGKH